METNFFFEKVEAFDIKKNVNIWIVESVNNEKKDLGVLNVIFCSDEHLLKMNIEHLGHDFFTDIITFDYSEANIISGDLFISKDRVADNAKKFSVSFEEEVLRVIIHGVLHLLGFKDKTEEEQKQMTNKENFYLDKLR